MGSIPGIAIVSCSQTRPKSLIKLISKTHDIQESSDQPGCLQHPWNIDTKYYTAQVNLLGIETTEIEKDEDFLSRIEALIIHMDSNSKTGLDDLKKWEFLGGKMKFLSGFENIIKYHDIYINQHQNISI
uniref:Alpha- and gamma-adaptin-binding protein p34-like n=1 Tax=Diabrotica virgifera virgifera TaxID=50390 RepID=A0A6P7F5R1_DIAVI